MYMILRRIYFKLNNLSWLVLIVSTVSLIALSTVAMPLIEPETFKTHMDSLWYTMTTILTVGYGDLSPSSTGGRLFTIVFLYLIGFALFTTLVGKGINFAVTNREKKERGEIMYERNNHIVIIDWSHKSRNAIREILRKNSKTEIVVIDTIERLSEIDGNIHYVKGDASNQRVLQNANIQGARAVLIFADERIESQLLADGKSLMIATAIERLAPSVHTTVEIEREEHLDNFRHINIDKFILANKSIAKMAVESLDK